MENGEELREQAVTLVFFACEGREHLLRRTYRSVKAAIGSGAVAQILLSFDGPCANNIVHQIQPDVFVQSPKRNGYVASIRRTLPLVKTKYFLWVEDDWEFKRKIDLRTMVDTLERHPSALQLRLMKRTLEDDERKHPVEEEEGVYESPMGFSANPSLNRTADVRRAIHTEPSSDNANIEHHLIDWCEQEGKTCLLVDPGKEPVVSHLGTLEKTSGQWHTTNPEERWENPKQPSSTQSIPISARLKMVVRLCVRTLYIAVTQLFNERAHGLSWRITNVIKQYKDERGAVKQAPATVEK